MGTLVKLHPFDEFSLAFGSYPAIYSATGAKNSQVLWIVLLGAIGFEPTTPAPKAGQRSSNAPAKDKGLTSSVPAWRMMRQVC
jgi:hypothetical protein